MPEAWRIVRAKYADTAFTGEGAAKFGGRWNSRGTWIVYTSSTLSLAALETLVHINPAVQLSYVALKLEFDDKLVEHLKPKDLPVDWRLEPPGRATQLLGDEWAKNLRSAILKVPSVLVSSESNLLLNPGHPDFKKIRTTKPEPFAFDPRLLT